MTDEPKTPRKVEPKQQQKRRLTKEEKALLRAKHDTTLFKVPIQRDNNGTCIPQYDKYTSTLKEKAPATEIIKNPTNARKLYTVKDAENNDVFISLEWLVGFFDGEGTLTFSLNTNKELLLGFQIQSTFIITQGEADYLLLTAIANFLGYGTVSVNRKDNTSVRYQVRIVNPAVLCSVIIPLFNIVKLRTKKGAEFIIWAKLTKELAEKKQTENWPTNMLNFISDLRNLKYVGSATNQALDYLSTLDKLEENVNNITANKLASEEMHENLKKTLLSSESLENETIDELSCED